MIEAKIKIIENVFWFFLSGGGIDESISGR